MGNGGAPVSLSPCQVAQARRYILNNRPAFAEITPAQQNGSSDLVIANGEDITWTFQRDLDGNVTIEDGGKLTISTAINMAEAKRITVEAGDELVLDCAHIKPRDGNTYWDGIVVEGVYNKPQAYDIFSQTRYVGFLQIRNSIIEKAKIGVRAQVPGNKFTTGGLVQARDATFLNCQQRCIDMQNFQNTTLQGAKVGNLSYFIRCDFVLDGNYAANFEDDFDVMAHLDRVDGISFTGCRFINGFPKTQSYSDERKRGIRALNAGFSVQGICGQNPAPNPCAQWDNSRFEGFYEAIYASSFSSSRTFSVSRTSFADNHLGISAYRVPAPYIVRNDFEVGSTLPAEPSAFGDVAHRGISLFRCTGYKVEQNDLVRFDHANTTDPVGILCSNSGPDANLVYLNTLDGLRCANLSNGANRDKSNPLLGLQYQCNINTGNDFDFAVPEEGEGNLGIAGNQGDFGLSAGNWFTPNPTEAEGHFLNKEAAITYFWQTGANRKPINYTTLTISLPLNPSPSNLCPSTLPDDDGEGVLSETEKEQYRQEFENSTDAVVQGHAADMLIRHFMVDSTQQDLDSVRLWLANKGGLESHFTIVDAWLQEGDAAAAQDALDTIPILFSLAGEDSVGHAHFSTLKNMQISALENGMDDAQLVAANQATLDQVATAGEYYAAFQARELVNKVNGPTYLPVVTLPDTAQQQGLMAPPSPTPGGFSRTGYQRLYVRAVPNPARDAVTFYFKIPQHHENGSVVLTTTDGRLVWESELPKDTDKLSLDLQGMAKGVYFYSLKVDGKVLKTERLVLLE